MNVKALVPKRIKDTVKAKILLKNRVLIGTHHKTGTVWMQSVFSSIAQHFKVRMEGRRSGEPPPESFDIFLNTHSDFDLARMSFPFKGLHLIRDPRDLIISATHYHCRAAESWLHVKNVRFGNLTYQEKINSYKTFDDQILFEMENSSFSNICAMKAWNYEDARFLNLHYEDLVADSSLEIFEGAFRHLGFRDWSLGWCLVYAYRNSLFSGAVNSIHVRSGKGRQWPSHFKDVHKKRFDQLFGDVLDRLGYDTKIDEAWLVL